MPDTLNPSNPVLTRPIREIAVTADVIAENLAVVDAHMRGEGHDPASVMSLYGDGIVLEIPARGLTFKGPEAIEANYRRMFGAMKILSFRNLDRFATIDRVVDESVVEVELIGHGYDRLPYPIGARVEIRLLHVFVMKGGKIMHETVYEAFSLMP